MPYIDGFILPVVTINKQVYLESAKFMSAIFLEHSAIRIMECWETTLQTAKLRTSSALLFLKLIKLSYSLGLSGRQNRHGTTA